MTATADQTRVDDAQQTYYQLLEVPPGATRSEIAQAYHRARAAFAPGSLATYALFTPEEAQLIAERVETAFRVLVDGHKRSLYDQSLEARARGEDVPAPDPAHHVRDPSATITDHRAEPPRPQDPEVPHEVLRAAPRGTPVVSREGVEEILSSVDRCDGSAIERLREARGVTLDQIYLSTKISLTNLRLIEEGNFASLPPAVYLRGYLRQIAQCLNVDADWVVDGYMARVEDWKTSLT
jgi:curved DNA-binding protein CbpA